MQNQQEVFQKILIVLRMQVYKKYFFKVFIFSYHFDIPLPGQIDQK